jgi:uncharacterized damage-inducible protein DinB
MSLADMFLGELEAEAPTTRSMLSRVPEGRPDWKPHPKSMNLQYLASHLAQLPEWVTMTIRETGLDVMPKPGSPIRLTTLMTTKELLDTFDAKLAEARTVLASATDEQMQEVWTLRAGEQVLLQQPRVAVLRSMVFNHMVHHRAQLGVYLRLNDIAIPPSYGPSADEMPAFAPPELAAKRNADRAAAAAAAAKVGAAAGAAQ